MQAAAARRRQLQSLLQNLAFGRGQPSQTALLGLCSAALEQAEQPARHLQTSAWTSWRGQPSQTALLGLCSAALEHSEQPNRHLQTSAWTGWPPASGSKASLSPLSLAEHTAEL